jgi:hypothetical protein
MRVGVEDHTRSFIRGSIGYILSIVTVALSLTLLLDEWIIPEDASGPIVNIVAFFSNFTIMLFPVQAFYIIDTMIHNMRIASISTLAICLACSPLIIKLSKRTSPVKFIIAYFSLSIVVLFIWIFIS